MPKASRNNEFCNCSRCWVQMHLSLLSMNTTWCPLISTMHNKMSHCALSIFSIPLIIFWTLLHSSSVKSLSDWRFYLNWSPHRSYYLLLVILVGLSCTFPITAHPFGEGKAELHVALNMPRVYKATVKRKKTPCWFFILLIPLPVIPRISFSLWLMKASAILRRTEAPLAQVAKAIWEWFCLYKSRMVILPCMFFYMNYYWIKSHLMDTSFIILNKFILPTMFFPFEPDLEKGYQGRCLWDSNISLIYSVTLIHHQWISLLFLLPNWRVSLNTALL